MNHDPDKKPHSVCVYCASSGVADPIHRQVARRLGGLLAQAGCTIISGGGKAGSMGALADGALEHDGRVIGVIPKFMLELEWGHRGISELHEVEDMRTRKHGMLTRASAVVALAGGCGTFEELMEAITLKRLGIYLGPIIIVNTGGYYDPLLEQFARSIRERFMDERHGQMWQVVAEPEEVVPALEAAPGWDERSIEFAALHGPR
ncbi:MAG: TIGR00730 family Rossman fold protein [Steroidobacteraceae bacterium]